VKWSERFSTGIPELDGQHRMLFQMSEHYRQTLDAGEGAGVYHIMLESLEDYARGHFGMEEQCMHRHQCPAAGLNKAAHGQFLIALTHFRERFATGGFEKTDARKLVDFIDSWLTNHIGRIDRRLKPCVERGESGGGEGRGEQTE
jgi:hemerythrin